MMTMNEAGAGHGGRQAMDLEKQAFHGAWHVRTHGRAPRIAEIAGKLDAWADVIEHFIDRLKLQGAGSGA